MFLASRKGVPRDGDRTSWSIQEESGPPRHSWPPSLRTRSAHGLGQRHRSQFEGFAAATSDSLLSTGYPMTGRRQGREDLVPGIRAEIANGQFKVVGPTGLHRQKAVDPMIPTGYTRADHTPVTGPKPKTIKK